MRPTHCIKCIHMLTLEPYTCYYKINNRNHNSIEYMLLFFILILFFPLFHYISLDTHITTEPKPMTNLTEQKFSNLWLQCYGVREWGKQPHKLLGSVGPTFSWHVDMWNLSTWDYQLLDNVWPNHNITRSPTRSEPNEMANEVAHFEDNKVIALTCAIYISCPRLKKSPSKEMEQPNEVKTSNTRAYEKGQN